MNIYSALWELLRPQDREVCPVCFGTIASADPPAVTLAGETLTEEVIWSLQWTLTPEDVGKTVALLALEDGFLALCPVSGGAA